MRCLGCNMNNESEEEKKEKLNTHTPKNKIQTKSKVIDKLRKMRSNLIVTICQPRVGSVRRFSREDRTFKCNKYYSLLWGVLFGFCSLWVLLVRNRPMCITG